MTRAERRRNEKGIKKQTATYVLTKEQLEKASKESAQRHFDEVYNRGFNAAIDEALVRVTTLSLMILNEQFEFGSNKKGTGRLDKFVMKLSEECAKVSEPATEFTLEYYAKLLEERTGINVTRK